MNSNSYKNTNIQYLRSYMVRFSPSIEQRKQFYNFKAIIWVWYGVAIMNALSRCLLTNRLHGKAAEICLVKS